MNPESPPSAPLSSTVTFTRGEELLRKKGELLARKLHLPLVEKKSDSASDLFLCYTKEGLELQLRGVLNASLRVDFLSDSLTYRIQHGGGIKQALARAVGIKPGIRPSVLDCTAGLGKDSFILASLGCRVTMIERNLLLAALLEDGLERAGEKKELQEVITNLTLLQGEATEILPTLTPPMDTVYLDPMYPHSKKSALNRQEMRIIRRLVGDDHDAGKLLESALEYAKKRVVVKRPKGAPLLSARQPSHVIKMKNSRYDVYMSPTFSS